MWVAILVGGLIGVLVLVLALGESGSPDSRSPLLGEPAPEVVGTTIDGEAFDLADHRGEWVVVNFFASWCAPCRLEHPELVRFAADHEDEATVVSLAFEDEEEDARAFFEDLGGDWPVLVEDTGGTGISFGITAVPETFLVDPDGTVRDKWISNVTAADLEIGLEQAAGSSP
jgi:cytochrome c biogenesis protein CcmG/thiol:disulfide interchange protein DsbE